MGWKRIVAGLAISIGLVSPLALYAKALSDRPKSTPFQTALFQGIDYERRQFNSPRPHVIHIVTVDFTVPGVEAFVTPGQIMPKSGMDTVAQTTSEFLNRFDLQVAVNAGFFKPFMEATPWSFQPFSGQGTDVLGSYMSNGDRYSFHPVNWPKICFSSDRKVSIREHQNCPDNTLHSVAGNLLLHPIPTSASENQRPFNVPIDKAYPRTIGAINAAGNKLWIIVVDGKQPGYSEGIKLAEAEHLLAELGVHKAVNLDGGGSVTLVRSQKGDSAPINAPIHAKWPMMERPIATHLGFFAPPLNPSAQR